MTTARRSSSSLSASGTAISSSNIRRVIALRRSGRLSVSSATPGAGRSSSIVSSCRVSVSIMGLLIRRGGLVADAAAGRVERVDLLGVLLVDGGALDLARERQLVAAGLPLALDDREPLELLDARQAGV